MDLTKIEDAKTYVQKGIFPAAKKILEESGVHYPLTFVFATQMRGAPLGDPDVIAIPFGTGEFSEAQREGYSAYIRHVIAETKAVGVVMITAAWVSTIDIDTPGVAPRPSEAPNREEILAVFFEHRDGNVFWKAPIVRGSGVTTLGPFETMKWDQSLGRFANMMNKPRPPEAEA
jgi:hypothetical protein